MKDNELNDSGRLKLGQYSKGYNIFKEEDETLKILLSVCNEMEHYSKRCGGCMPKIEITSNSKVTENQRKDKPDLTIHYEGPICHSPSSALNEFDQVLSSKTNMLERHEDYERTNFKIEI
ncbi:MAG: hypothetical protein ABEK17_01470 [Candidatus Aenigmatarchaeota archaeon]